jgi:hypothetical protein
MPLPTGAFYQSALTMTAFALGVRERNLQAELLRTISSRHRLYTMAAISNS